MQHLANFVAVAVGGAAGSMGRYALWVIADAIPGGHSVLGTLAANVLGCFLIGIIVQLAVVDAPLLLGMGFPQWTIAPRTLLAIRVGVLGGLTTFSSFAAESVMLHQKHSGGISLAYVAANLILGVLAVVIGMAIVRGYIPSR
ncbi:MAG: CrcB family protein [Planctomycetota bacterium]